MAFVFVTGNYSTYYTKNIGVNLPRPVKFILRVKIHTYPPPEKEIKSISNIKVRTDGKTNLILVMFFDKTESRTLILNCHN